MELSLASAADLITNPKNRKISDPANSSQLFCFLSRNQLPGLPGFPVYTRQGEVLVRVWTLPQTVFVDADQIELLRKFHQYLFSEVLRLEKYSMIYRPSEAENSVVLAPLKKDGENFLLDWDFAEKMVNLVPNIPRQPTDEEREKFVFESDRYFDAIVMPWYRNMDQPHFYYVAEVCQNLSPKSPFPDDEYNSFNEYFTQKYGININNQDQPLLDVDYTSSRLNLLTPRFFNRRGQLLKSIESRPCNAISVQKQILVPELVDIHPIPASMWNMIVVLPSSLYRINSLLVANELRVRIMDEGFGRSDDEFPADFQWEPLDYGWEKNFNSLFEEGKMNAGGAEYRVADSESYLGRQKRLDEARKEEAKEAAARDHRKIT